MEEDYGKSFKKPEGPKAPFQGKSSYKTEYLPHEIKPQPQEEMPAYRRKGPRFEGDTVYKNDYVPKEIPQEDRYSPEDEQPYRGPRP